MVLACTMVGWQVGSRGKREVKGYQPDKSGEEFLPPIHRQLRAIPPGA